MGEDKKVLNLPAEIVNAKTYNDLLKLEDRLKHLISSDIRKMIEDGFAGGRKPEDIRCVMVTVGYTDNSVHFILPPHSCLEFMFDGISKECTKQISKLGAENIKATVGELEEKKVSKKGKSDSDKN